VLAPRESSSPPPDFCPNVALDRFVPCGAWVLSGQSLMPAASSIACLDLQNGRAYRLQHRLYKRRVSG
jgi:hypothetical protein